MLRMQQNLVCLRVVGHSGGRCTNAVGKSRQRCGAVSKCLALDRIFGIFRLALSSVLEPPYCASDLYNGNRSLPSAPVFLHDIFPLLTDSKFGGCLHDRRNVPERRQRAESSVLLRMTKASNGLTRSKTENAGTSGSPRACQRALPSGP